MDNSPLLQKLTKGVADEGKNIVLKNDWTILMNKILMSELN